MTKPLRLGILGAAKIAPAAAIRPCEAVQGIEVVAVAARDRRRAQKFAHKHGLQHVHTSYKDLIQDPDIDAVYNPLPNGLHGQWTLAALDAGKHVLCEKPLAANAQEAQAMADKAQSTGLQLMEAFHWRYHDLPKRVASLIADGEIGQVQSVSTHMCFPLPLFSDIRWQWSLAGGALMDAGCYSVSLARFFSGAEEAGAASVEYANAKLRGPQIDRQMRAALQFNNGVSAVVEASMWSRTLLKMAVTISGSEGDIRIFNPVLPQAFHRITVNGNSGRRSVKAEGEGTYTAQMRAFVQAVTSGDPAITDGRYGVENMRIIDEIYRAANLPIRQPASELAG